jgi:hypothetical protein
MSEELHRIVGGLEAKQDAILSMLKEDRESSREYREGVAAQMVEQSKRITALERIHDEVKWTIKGVMLAGSAIGAVIASGAMLVWKWIFG